MRLGRLAVINDCVGRRQAGVRGTFLGGGNVMHGLQRGLLGIHSVGMGMGMYGYG
jgi:hypothetical protein